MVGTYLGGPSGGNVAWGIDVDEQGATYVGGMALSLEFPTTPGAFQTEAGPGFEGFVAKFTPDGASLAYATYIGGSDEDEVRGLAVDEAGAAYVTGRTTSPDFPTTPGAADTSFDNGEAFVLKLQPDGAGLEYGTFLGGSGGEEGHDLVVDEAGAAFVTGLTTSPDFPVSTGSAQTEFGGGYFDGFVAKIDPDGGSFGYSTYLGGSSTDCEIGGIEQECSIAVGRDGSAYIGGPTYSHDFPVTDGAYATEHNGERDGFVARLAPDGSQLLYATYLGGSGDDCRRACSVGVDRFGSAYLAGSTSSDNFPVSLTAYQDALAGDWDGFLARLSPDGTHLLYATYLGGGGFDEAWTLAVTPAGEAFVAGETYSGNFPTTGDGAGDCASCPDEPDAFVAQFGLDGSLRYAHVPGRKRGGSGPYRHPRPAAKAGARRKNQLQRLPHDGRRLPDRSHGQ